MVHLVKKKIKGQSYLYLEECVWQNGKSKRLWQKYLGPEKQMQSVSSLSFEPSFTIDNYDFGLPIALMQIVEKLDLIHIIDQATLKRKQGLSVGQYIVIAALNRCIKPISKRRLLNWFQSTYLQQFFPIIETYLDSMAYTNHFEYLTEDNLTQIQTELNKQLIQEFGIDMTELVYDATNFFTYILPEDEEGLVQYGHSKENRTNLGIVGLALLCTQDGGIPILYDVYPGNLQDAGLFKTELPKILQRIADLKIKGQKIVLTFDKGNNSPEIFKILDDDQIEFIVSLRPSMIKDLAELSENQFPRYTLPNGKEIGIIEQSRDFYGQPRRLMAIYNSELAKRAGLRLTEKIEQRIAEVNEFFKNRLNVKKWRTIDDVRIKIEQMIENKELWAFLVLSLTEKGGKIAYSLQINQEALQKHIATLGKSYLITNIFAKPAVDVIALFRQQATIEKAFSYLKSPDILRARPIFHSKDTSIQGHLFTCVIGLLLLMLLYREIQKNEPSWSLRKIVEILSSITVSKINFSGTAKQLCQFSQLSHEAEKMRDLLHLNDYI